MQTLPDFLTTLLFHWEVHPQSVSVLVEPRKRRLKVNLNGKIICILQNDNNKYNLKYKTTKIKKIVSTIKLNLTNQLSHEVYCTPSISGL